jgi:thiol:disulfide interchange protein DsbD
MTILNDLSALIQTNPLLAFPAVFLAGVLVSFTPCVYPVIPLTLGYIGARGGESRWRGFSLSLVYVLGMALVYACLGAFASLTGQLFGKVGSHPASYFIVGNVFLLLGLSALGVFELPQFYPSSSSKKRAGYLGVFLVGMFSGLIVGPCTAPAMAAILVYVGSKQNVVYGFSLLLVFGYGVGFLLILLGTFTGLVASMPRSGPWLVVVKKTFGWILIAAAEYLFIHMGGLLI